MTEYHKRTTVQPDGTEVIEERTVDALGAPVRRVVVPAAPLLPARDVVVAPSVVTETSIGAPPVRRVGGTVLVKLGGAGANSSPTERARSTITYSQWLRNAAIWPSSSMRNPCSRKGVSTHGRSRSATNMPTLMSARVAA